MLLNPREEKFLWQQGIASEDFKYKGKGLFSNGVKKVYSKDGIIKKGEPIMVVAIAGFDLIIKKATVAK